MAKEKPETKTALDMGIEKFYQLERKRIIQLKNLRGAEESATFAGSCQISYITLAQHKKPVVAEFGRLVLGKLEWMFNKALDDPELSPHFKAGQAKELHLNKLIITRS
jgi:hypothetical protein